MAQLRVKLRGQPVFELNLSPEKEYVAGRKEDCDIVLQPEKGISREHFKIAFVDGSWQVDVVSRYGEVFHNGEANSQFKLQHGNHFSVPPYEFDFLLTTDDVASQMPEAHFGEEGAYTPNESHIPMALTPEVADGNFSAGSDEKTVVGVAPTTAFIKIVDAQNEPQEMIRLDDGESWVAGRDTSCHILIRDQRVSRRQFEIRRLGSQFYIIDLGSVNGTLVNGNPVSSTDVSQLRSGDAISVLTNYLYFELHDSSFQSRLEGVNIPAPNHLVPLSNASNSGEYPQSPVSYQDPQYQAQGMVPYQYDQSGVPVPYQQQMHYPTNMQQPMYPTGAAAAGDSKKFDFQKHRPKLIIGTVALLALIFVFSGNESKKGPVPQQGGMITPGSPLDIFNKLAPEQQALVRQRYKDAKNMYMQGKYQLAQEEIIKIQELVPDYEDIKEIERLSKEAIFIQEQQRRQEQIEKDRQETEQKIAKQIIECQKIINPNVTAGELENCLSPVLQFNPDHPKMNELRSQVEVITMQREAQAAERAAYQSQVGQLRAMYDRAQSVHKKGKPLDAIAAYEKVVGSGLPDPNGYKGQSKRNIASIRQMMNSKTASLQAEAEKHYNNQNLKNAILALRQARLVDPTNPEIPEKIELYIIELRKQMMAIYQEGILEESFGNVDGGESKAGAKQKWKKILELDVPDGEYYKKAFIKLKKYGALQ